MEPASSEAILGQSCEKHGYELRHYCVDCDEVVCTMKEHYGHNHDMLKNRSKQSDIITLIAEDTNVSSHQAKKRKMQAQHNAFENNGDNCEYTFDQMVGKVTLLYREHAVSGASRLPDCTMSSPIVISEHIKATVTLKDAYGFPIVNQSLDVSCNKELGFMKNLQIKEHGESRGQYVISYNPKRIEHHLLTVYWKEFHCTSKIVENLREYANINKEVKIITKYSPHFIIKAPYLLAKGPDNQIIFRSGKEIVVFDKYLQYSHVIGRTGKRCTTIFKAITGLAVDKNGNLYVADCDLHCILKFTLNGIPVSMLGCKGTGDGQFRSPYGLLLTQSQSLFVCDLSNHRVQVFKDEKFSYCFGEQGKEPGTCNYPIDLTTNNSEDKLFITDCNCRVQVFSTQGQFLKVFECHFTGVPYQLQRPIGIHHTPDGHLLISCHGTHCVMVFKDDGEFVSAIEGIHRGKERFTHPCGVVAMDNGQIVIAASYNRLVVF